MWSHNVNADCEIAIKKNVRPSSLQAPDAKQMGTSVVVERLGLELVGDRPGLVPHVARVVVAEARHLDLRDHDLLGVAPCAHHAARRVQARRARRALADFVEQGGVVLRVGDGIGHGYSLLSGGPAIFHQLPIRVDSSAPTVPALGNPSRP